MLTNPLFFMYKVNERKGKGEYITVFDSEDRKLGVIAYIRKGAV